MKPTNVTNESFESGAECFRENGFFIFKVYEPEEAREILEAVRLKNLDRERALYDNDVNYDRHFDIAELAHHVTHPAVVRRLQSLFGDDVLCWRSEFFPKFPGQAATEWHQVEAFQYTTGVPQLVPTERYDGVPTELTAWTAFNDTDRNNGCLKFMPGSHRRWRYDESKASDTGRNEEYDPTFSETSFYGYNFADFKVDPDWEPDDGQAFAAEMRAGECVVFTSRCIHGSFANTTKRSTRFAINARYVPTHVKVYPDRTEFKEHGGHFDLSRYGCVLVGGEENYGHNRVRSHDNRGEAFPAPQPPLASREVGLI
ncbi:MAG: chlorinating enzyme [Planctomycetota bacterium]